MRERGCEPLLVTLGLPPSVADEEAIDLRGHHRVDQVGGVAFSESGLEGAGASQCACDLALPLIALMAELAEKFRGPRIGPGRAHEDVVDVVRPLVDRRGDTGEAGEELARVGFGEHRSDVGPFRHRKGLIVTGDGRVEQGLEYPELRGEEAVHGRRRHVGVLADRFDGRRRVAALEEQRPCRFDHRSPGEPRAGLTTPAVAS